MEVDLVEISCCWKPCRVSFWITKKHDDRLRNCHNTFYCPNGHGQSYGGESDKQKLKRLEQSLKNRDWEINHLTKSKSALKGVITRMKNKT